MALVTNNVFSNQDVWGLIYKFDSTYRDIFKGCIDQLKWIELKKKQKAKEI